MEFSFSIFKYLASGVSRYVKRKTITLTNIILYHIYCVFRITLTFTVPFSCSYCSYGFLRSVR
jgi:hypothetical protein